MQFCKSGGGGRGVKSRARGFYDNCPQYPSDWWLWDVPPSSLSPHHHHHPSSSSPNAHMNTVSIVKERSSVGEGGDVSTGRNRKGKNREQWQKEVVFFKARLVCGTERGKQLSTVGQRKDQRRKKNIQIWGGAESEWTVREEAKRQRGLDWNQERKEKGKKNSLKQVKSQRVRAMNNMLTWIICYLIHETPLMITQSLTEN